MNKIFKRSVDIAMSIVLLFLMAMQVTQQAVHEWLGIAMTVLCILHHILNRKYYKAIFKGRFTPLRVYQLVVNTALLTAFIITPLSGIMMSRYAVPFLSGIVSSSMSRTMHLMFSYWLFVLMGLHIGNHLGIMASKLPKGTMRKIAAVICGAVSVYGMWLFIKAGIFKYMFMQSMFAFIDYSEAWWLVIIKNLAMLFSWSFISYLISIILKKIGKRKAIK